jgi:RNA ligase (TIGR02306 family)
MIERVMARIVRVDDILPIEGADNIEVALIGGWKVVVKKGEYQKDQLAVYAEVDSWIPHSIAPFLTKPGQFPKVYNEVEGQRLRTIKLRGQISQGLLLPMKTRGSDGLVVGALFSEGDDVSGFFGIQKWEPPAEFRAANAKGSFPYFIPKTDQERIQNLTRQLEKWNAEGHTWQVTEKVDGSSMTIYFKDGEVGVCSRNLELKDDGTSTFWETAKAEGLIDKLKVVGKNLAFQGELIGGQIQGNAYKVSKFEFHLYNIFDIDQQQYMLPESVSETALQLSVRHVPILQSNLATQTGEATVESLLNMAEGKSVIGAKPEREGLVFKSLTQPDVSFKVISNRWLCLTGN